VLKKIVDIKCSVIILAYNQAKTIAQCLDCILNQECNFQYEIIVGDDFSTDGTGDILLNYITKYPNTIRLLTHNKNVGITKNFVMCIKQAEGEYIGICAADDFWHNNHKLQLQKDYLDSHPEYGFVYTDYDRLNTKNNKTYRNWIKRSGCIPYEGPKLIKLFGAGKVPALALTVLFRKDLFNKFVPYEDYVYYEFPIEDWPTWIILSKYTSVGYIPISTATYRFGHESLSNPLSYIKIKQKYDKERIMYQYLCNSFPKDLHLYENEWEIKVNRILLNLAYKKLDFQAAKNFALQLIKLGSNHTKVRMAKYWPTFIFFSFMKFLRQKISK
jgi:glycosyltransferase involved in cell wall biosynthesis